MRNGLAKCLVESGLVVRSANKADVVAIGGLLDLACHVLSHTHPANTFSRQTVKTALTAILKAKHFKEIPNSGFSKVSIYYSEEEGECRHRRTIATAEEFLVSCCVYIFLFLHRYFGVGPRWSCTPMVQLQCLAILGSRNDLPNAQNQGFASKVSLRVMPEHDVIPLLRPGRPRST